MPASVTHAGPGFALYMSDSSGVNYTRLGQVKDIDGPQEDVDMSEITNQDSPGANGSLGWQEFVSSVQKGGTVTFDMVHHVGIPTQGIVSGIQFVKRQGLPRNFQIYENPTGGYIGNVVTTFSAFVAKYSTKRPVSGHSELTGITLQITGPITGPQ